MANMICQCLMLCACILSCIAADEQVVEKTKGLSVADRFSIYEAMNLHQVYIDLDPGCDNSHTYASLYWPDGTFRVIDAKSGRDQTFNGLKGIRQIFDYAHSVFPLYQWQHSVGQWEISEAGSSSEGEKATAQWKWRVDWKANTTGVVSTGYYNDVFEKRDGVWKVLHRTSTDDPNWPIQIFAPYIANEDRTFVSSCGDA